MHIRASVARQVPHQLHINCTLQANCMSTGGKQQNADFQGCHLLGRKLLAAGRRSVCLLLGCLLVACLVTGCLQVRGGLLVGSLLAGCLHVGGRLVVPSRSRLLLLLLRGGLVVPSRSVPWRNGGGCLTTIANPIQSQTLPIAWSMLELLAEKCVTVGDVGKTWCARQAIARKREGKPPYYKCGVDWRRAPCCYQAWLH